MQNEATQGIGTDQGACTKSPLACVNDPEANLNSSPSCQCCNTEHSLSASCILRCASHIACLSPVAPERVPPMPVHLVFLKGPLVLIPALVLHVTLPVHFPLLKRSCSYQPNGAQAGATAGRD